MRMKQIVENRTLKDTVAEFYAFKQAQKIRERTLQDYRRYIDPFVEQSSDSMNINVLKKEILEYFAAIPATSPARYNHPYQYLHLKCRFRTQTHFSQAMPQGYGIHPSHGDSSDNPYQNRS